MELPRGSIFHLCLKIADLPLSSLQLTALFAAGVRCKRKLSQLDVQLVLNHDQQAEFHGVCAHALGHKTGTHRCLE